MTGRSNLSRVASRQFFSKSTWARCPACSGDGVLKGMFAHSPEYGCGECSAFGWVPPDGKPLTPEESALLLRKMVNRLILKNQQLKRPTKPEDADQGYGQGRYMGD